LVSRFSVTNKWQHYPRPETMGEVMRRGRFRGKCWRQRHSKFELRRMMRVRFADVFESLDNAVKAFRHANYGEGGSQGRMVEAFPFWTAKAMTNHLFHWNDDSEQNESNNKNNIVKNRPRNEISKTLKIMILPNKTKQKTKN